MRVALAHRQMEYREKTVGALCAYARSEICMYVRNKGEGGEYVCQCSHVHIYYDYGTPVPSTVAKLIRKRYKICIFKLSRPTPHKTHISIIG